MIVSITAALLDLDGTSRTIAMAGHLPLGIKPPKGSCSTSSSCSC